MSVKFGEIDISQIVDNEFRIKFLTKVVEWLINHNTALTRPSSEEIEKMRSEVVEELKEKYPNSGIELITEAKNAENNKE